MTEREKLIDLLCYVPGAEEIADFFLANGVTIPVHCKDCKHWIHMEKGVGDCINPRFHIEDCADVTMDAEEFCCLGERKTDDDVSP